MKNKEIYSEISSIRNLMERSSKFISLSGLSGVMAGIYALLGGIVAYRVINSEGPGFDIDNFHVNESSIWRPLVLIALAILVLSIVTCIWLTIRQAKKKGENVWAPGSKRLFVNLLIPLITGGLFIVILLVREHYDLIVPSSLIFYGLALISGSHYTFTDVKWLGFCQIVLGLLAALLPGYAFIFWVVGFGFLHILYGSIMHFKYDK